MSTELHIRHCDIRIRRRPDQGACWAGESEHRTLAESVQKLVLQGLAELVAPHIVQLGADTAPSELSLDLTLDHADLRGAAPLARRHLRQRVARAVRAALGHARREDAIVVAATPAGKNPPASAAVTRRDQWSPPMPVAGLLLRWHDSGYLTTALDRLGLDALITLLAGVLDAAPARTGRRALSGATHFYEETLRCAARADLQATIFWMRRALTAAAIALVDNLDAHEKPDRGQPLPARAVSRAADAAAAVCSKAPAAGEATTDERRDDDRRLADEHGHGQPVNRTIEQLRGRTRPRSVSDSALPGGSVIHALVNGRYAVDSLLPLLLLGPLSRHGILDAIGSASDDEQTTSAFAFALALHCLPPPTDATRCDDRAQRTAGLFAATAGDINGAAISAAAHSGAPLAALVTGAVALALLRNLRVDLPLPLIRDGGRYVVFDSCGLYPLCRSTAADLGDWFRDSNAVFFLAETDVSVVSEIECAGLAAVAPGAPTRGERWSLLTASGGWTGMTNATSLQINRVRNELSGAARTTDRARAVWHALVSRPALVADSARGEVVVDFEHTAAMAAGFALADIGWTLFGRAPGAWAEPDPLLVIQRFHNLSGTLEVTDGCITAVLPLGARFTDLRDAGLLDSLAPPPWWSGRHVAFRGG